MAASSGSSPRFKEALLMPLLTMNGSEGTTNQHTMQDTYAGFAIAYSPDTSCNTIDVRDAVSVTHLL